MPLSSLPRSAEIIAVGSELLTPFRSDTNSLFITSKLNEIGIDVTAKLIVGDRRDELAAFVRACLERADLLVLTGGLGPTDDDVTREAVADAIGLAARRAPADRRADPRAVRGARDGDAGGEPQAGAGAARGGDPAERERHGAGAVDRAAMARRCCCCRGRRARCGRCSSASRRPPRAARRRRAHSPARAEDRRAAPNRTSRQLAQPVYSTLVARWTPPVATSILAAPGQIELHFSMRAATRGRGTGDAGAGDARDAGGPRRRRLQHRRAARSNRWWATCCASAAGGSRRPSRAPAACVASRLTDVAGSSDYVERGVVCYSNRAKIRGTRACRPTLIAAHGAVSEPVALAMADGARQRAGRRHRGGHHRDRRSGRRQRAEAGRDRRRGGGRGRPAARSTTFRFPGGREQVKFQSSQAALNMLRMTVGWAGRARG